MNYYFIGDIHGYLKELTNLFLKISPNLTKDDVIVFLGDYVDRGEFSYEVIDFIISIQKKYNTVCLKGNHEEMFLQYLSRGDNENIYFANGGSATVKSYRKNLGELKLPKSHERFFDGLKFFHEGDDFIAVHAGLDPLKHDIDEQTEKDILWIREKFYRSEKKWEKTIIFGHTPTIYMASRSGIFIDTQKNIIGIDNGVVFNRNIICLRWPDLRTFESREGGNDV